MLLYLMVMNIPSVFSKMEVFSRFHAVPFSKMLSFYRSEPFSLEAKYSNINDIPYNSVNIGML